MANKISCRELYQWITDNRDFLIIDVLPPEYFESRRLPGARNACVYEMVFLDRVREITEDRDQCIVVYDSSDRSMASSCAASKLEKAGYGDVHELVGGIEEWEGSGYPVEVLGPETEEEPILTDGRHVIDCGRSSLEWTGRTIGKKHCGSIAVSGGEIVVRDGGISGGSITVDMTSLSNADLADKELNSLLIRHLSSDDFFDVEQYPSACFELSEGSPLVGATPGSPNYFIRGKLTIKGITREVSIAAAIAPGENGGIKAHAYFDIDRTEWNILYGSGKLFERLGMHLVNDLITLELIITTK